MSVSELNELMTYVVEGWMLFSAGFISTTFIAFVSKRIQEDIQAAAIAQTEDSNLTLSAGVTDTEDLTVTEAVQAVSTQLATPSSPTADSPAPSTPNDSRDATEIETEIDAEIDAEETARLEEVAAVSEKLAKEKQKQSGASSVSVST